MADPLLELKAAAIEGDVEFLKKCVASETPPKQDYYMSFFEEEEDKDDEFGNIFHLALEAGEMGEEFIQEAINILTPENTQQLLLQTSNDTNKWNPLHVAAYIGNTDIVNMFLRVYKTLPSDLSKRPWLQKNDDGQTPCFIAFEYDEEETGIEILKKDMKELCNIVTEDGIGLLYNVVSKGYEDVALMMLNSDYRFTTSGYNGNTPLHCITNCSEEEAEKIIQKLIELEPGIITHRNEDGETIFHSWADEYELWPFQCLLKNTPPSVNFAELLTVTDEDGDNPLHTLVSYEGRPEDVLIEVVEFLIQSFKASKLPSTKIPWLAKNTEGHTPLSLALKNNYEDFAMKLLDVDENPVENYKENNVLFKAIKEGRTDFTKKILDKIEKEKIWTKLLINEKKETILHITPLYKKDMEFLKQLLVEHKELLETKDKEENSVLHYWLSKGSVWHLEELLKIESDWRKDIIKFSYKTNKDQNNPLHVAASHSTHEGDEGQKEMEDVVKLLIKTYKEEYPKWTGYDLNKLPWFSKNINKEGPLHLAIRNKNEKLASYILSLYDHEDKPISKLLDHYSKKQTLLIAMENDCTEVTKAILEKFKEFTEEECQKYLIDPLTKRTVLHLAPSCKDKKFGEWLVDKVPTSIIKQHDNKDQSPLYKASEFDAAWIIQAILKKDPSALENAHKAWVKACDEGHKSALEAFVKYNPGKFRDHCIKRKDSPLHHLSLPSLTDNEEYIKLERMKDLINLQNSDDETPLHIAIQKGDIFLTETLLNVPKVLYNIKDKDGKTAIDLLAKLCDGQGDWDHMCMRFGFDPRTETTYFEYKKKWLLEL